MLFEKKKSLVYFKTSYSGHVRFVIRRYGIPVEESQWIETQGVLVGKLLNQCAIESADECAAFFLFLVMNCYALGPRIAREFFICMFEESPHFSENGIRKWNEITKHCRELIRKGTSYHDMIGAKPIRVTKETFEKNLERVYSNNK